MTPILSVISGYCAVYVDDENLNELATTDAPLYARRMWGLLNPAIGLFTSPAEMQEYLSYTAPTFADTTYTATATYTSDFTVSLGSEYIGYGLSACRVKAGDGSGTVIMIPFPITYDNTTGNVVVHATSTNPIANGTVLTFDFYKDGSFDNTLELQVQNILGMCFQVVWQDRFNTDWLSIVSKVEDKSFREQNRANKMIADTARLEALKKKLDEAMQHFENRKNYDAIISQTNRLKI